MRIQSWHVRTKNCHRPVGCDVFVVSRKFVAKNFQTCFKLASSFARVLKPRLNTQKPGGMGENEANGLPFRLANDLTLILTKERKLLSLADFLRQCATVQGVAEVELADHVLTPKQRPAPWKQFMLLVSLLLFQINMVI